MNTNDMRSKRMTVQQAEEYRLVSEAYRIEKRFSAANVIDALVDAVIAASVQGEQEPVAWLYKAEGFADAFSKRRLPADVLYGSPTETALYAAPLPQGEQDRTPWLPYLSDRADGCKGHYAIARWNPAGYQEVWNLLSHRWSSASERPLTLEEAHALLRATSFVPQGEQCPSGWISVDERLPGTANSGEDVLISRPITNGQVVQNITDYARFYAGKWHRQDSRTYEECGYHHPITHWMPLPPPPAQPKDAK